MTFLEISGKYIKLFLSIFYLTEGENLKHDFWDVITHTTLIAAFQQWNMAVQTVFIWTFVSTECVFFNPLYVMQTHSVHDKSITHQDPVPG